jgi:hypothetical protein
MRIFKLIIFLWFYSYAHATNFNCDSLINKLVENQFIQPANLLKLKSINPDLITFKFTNISLGHKTYFLETRYNDKKMHIMTLVTHDTNGKKFASSITGPLPVEFKSKGIGTISYLVAARYLSERGTTLVSDYQIGVSDESNQLWLRLVDAGIARQIGLSHMRRYEIIPEKLYAPNLDDFNEFYHSRLLE